MKTDRPAEEPARLSDYDERVRSEVRYFQDGPGNLPYPEAHHYWTNRYLRPEVERVYGVSGLVPTYVVDCVDALGRQGNANILSIGCGEGETEIAIARRLLEEGFSNVRVDCMELAPGLCESGRARAAAAGLSDHVFFLEEDMNTWRPAAEGCYAVVIANQILHHIYRLESFFESARQALVPGGKFLTRDMIGRNGHVCWPEVKAVVDQVWSRMPKRYSYDHIFQKHFPEYPNRDNSKDCFEGIRSQDILPLLRSHFHFERFVAFGGLIERFAGRAFGHNLDVKENEGDRTFTDMIYLLNKSLIDAGAIKPTQMIATLSRDPCAEPVCGYGWTPEFCVRPPEG